MQALLAYAWPGNIRELRNVIERAVVLGHGSMIELADLPDTLRTAVAITPASAHATSPSELPAAPAVFVADSGAAGQAAERRLPAARATLAACKDQTELAIITQALERNSHNRLRAAAELGISRMTLYKKLHKYGLMGAV
jgi:DNA-binding NtrC family response regulator